MRSNSLFVLIAMTLSPMLLAQEKPGAKDKPAKNLQQAQRVDKLTPQQREFLKLPAEKRQEHVKNLQEAARLFSRKEILQSLNSLRLAETAFADNPELWNMRGSCYVEIRAFDKALESFQKALNIAGDNPSILFNVGEVYFVSQQWQKAHDIFKTVMDKLPTGRQGLGRITEFKLMLCKLKLGKEDEAQILSEKYDYQDDSPYHYYAKAAMACHRDDMTTGQEEIARAGRIFREPQILAPWQDTLIEFGYIKSHYGSSE